MVSDPCQGKLNPRHTEGKLKKTLEPQQILDCRLNRKRLLQLHLRRLRRQKGLSSIMVLIKRDQHDRLRMPVDYIMQLHTQSIIPAAFCPRDAQYLGTQMSLPIDIHSTSIPICLQTRTRTIRTSFPYLHLLAKQVPNQLKTIAYLQYSLPQEDHLLPCLFNDQILNLEPFLSFPATACSP
jgi:hypothetical protein